jgi:hypothetical protein
MKIIDQGVNAILSLEDQLHESHSDKDFGSDPKAIFAANFSASLNGAGANRTMSRSRSMATSAKTRSLTRSMLTPRHSTLPPASRRYGAGQGTLLAAVLYGPHAVRDPAPSHPRWIPYDGRSLPHYHQRRQARRFVGRGRFPFQHHQLYRHRQRRVQGMRGSAVPIGFRVEQGCWPLPNRVDEALENLLTQETSAAFDVFIREPHRPEHRDRFDSIQYWYWKHWKFFRSEVKTSIIQDIVVFLSLFETDPDVRRVSSMSPSMATPGSYELRYRGGCGWSIQGQRAAVQHHGEQLRADRHPSEQRQRQPTGDLWHRDPVRKRSSVEIVDR